MDDGATSLVAQRDALASGTCSSTELIDGTIDRHDQTNASLNAVLGLRADAARAEAKESDVRRAAGELRSSIDGIPILLKDNMVQRGELTTCSSRILEGYVSPYDSCVVEKLQAAGAIIMGRTNMDEFAMGSSTENSVHGAAHNPWDLERACGGSSGGSAASVAAGITQAALGSDTGGSIRQPASFCGVTGIKPTYGRVSRWGLVAYASSLDQIGCFTHTAQDAAIVLQTIAGHDERDSTSIPDAVPDYSAALTGDIRGLKVGLPKECFETEGTDPEVQERVRAGIAELEAAGAEAVEVNLPHTKYGVAAYYLIATAEASSNLARFDGARYGHRASGAKDLKEMYERSRSEGFGAEVKRRIMLGTYVLSAGYFDAYYKKAQQVRTLLRQDFESAFAKCDVIATPTSPEVAFKLGEKIEDPISMYLSDVFTVSANLAGIPGVSVPCGTSANLPVGLQLLGRVLDEETLLRTADVFQQRTDHHTDRPGGIA